MQIKELYNYLDAKYPFDTQADWDASRMIVYHQREIKTIVVTLDLDANALAYSLKNRADLIISHHPLFIDPPTNENLHAREIFASLEKAQINVIFLHTPFDQAKEGMNFSIAAALQLLNPRFPSNNQNYVIADLPTPMELGAYIKVIKHQMSLDFVKIDPRCAKQKISTLAICGGSGGSFIPDLEAVDAYLTCDLKYHAWIDAADQELALIDVNHNIENIFIDQIIYQLKKFIPSGTKLLANKSKLKFEII